jgi:hypothetical protein
VSNGSWATSIDSQRNRPATVFYRIRGKRNTWPTPLPGVHIHSIRCSPSLMS